jgi:hypothetical protein
LVADALAGHRYFDWAFAFNPVPVPNWLTHILLGMLVPFFEASTAERIVIGGYVLLLPLAFRYFIRSVYLQTYGVEFLSLPLVYNAHLHWGFYNFCYSLGIYLLTAGYWVRVQRQLTARRCFVLSALGVLLFLSHPLSLMQACACIGVITVWETFRVRDIHLLLRRGAAAIASFAPALILYATFSRLRLQKAESVLEWPSIAYAASNLLRLAPLKSFTERELWVGQAMMLLIGIAVACTFVRALRTRTVNEWFLLAAMQSVIVFLFPVTASGGTMITPRLVYYPLFSLVAYLPAVKWSTRWTAAAMLAGVLACVALHTLHWPMYERYDARLHTLINGSPRLVPGRSVLFSVSEPINPLTTSGGVPNVSPNILGYLGARDRLVLLNNYESATDHFPLINRPAMNVVARLDPSGRMFDLCGYERNSGRPVDYLVVLGTPPDWLRTVPFHRVPVEESGYPIQIFERVSGL